MQLILSEMMQSKALWRVLLWSYPLENIKLITSLIVHNKAVNISTTIHATTKSFVPFCSAQDGESTDMNSLVF